jgi:hypothetical protein
VTGVTAGYRRVAEQVVLRAIRRGHSPKDAYDTAVWSMDMLTFVNLLSFALILPIPIRQDVSRFAAYLVLGSVWLLVYQANRVALDWLGLREFARTVSMASDHRQSLRLVLGYLVGSYLMCLIAIGIRYLRYG